jgi:nicotinate-nucleotide adenylyltransferase
LALDAVVWVPAGQPWQKERHLTDAAHRRAMVQAAIAHEPRFALNDTELRREGPSYTLDTVTALQSQESSSAQWFLIIGQDQYAGLHTWRGWQDLLGRVVLAVAQRPGSPLAVNPGVAAVSHRKVALPMMDISSTDIRQRTMHGQGIDGLVPSVVARYIEQHSLYRGPTGN